MTTTARLVSTPCRPILLTGVQILGEGKRSGLFPCSAVRAPCSISVRLSWPRRHRRQRLSDMRARTLQDWGVKRVTKETNVHVRINLDGTGLAECSTGIPFLDHMLDALLQGLGDRKGINRFGHFTAPLDEAALRLYCHEQAHTLVEHFFQSLVNTSGMTLHIRQCPSITYLPYLLSLLQLAGKNSHHIIEASFKAFARALRQATEYDLRRRGTVPSSKGVLSRS
ncbi:hypothetical protein HU200_064179 [Digitaria exilis]|uniref:imidazoleglycerol-phosphate dehydratase n=1 Tax=Digitaria exilis TaxID=1010633 RepID=A0A835A080_9POAL|nr:hypothetical protein HU200_064179 [Digitaria exilis]